jgi:hypothetical protein
MLPPALLRPLKFGDVEQIRAMRELDRMIEEMSAEVDEKGVPIEAMKLFRVTVTMAAEHTMKVYATDKASAIKKAEEEFGDIANWELDFDVDYYAREVKAK